MTKKLLAANKFQAGFTLIELLIVIVIIVIVIGVGAASYTTVARNARNADRLADLRAYADALERYFADHGFYPGTNGPPGSPLYFKTWGLTNATPGAENPINCLLGGTIASGQPIPPGNVWSCTRDQSGNPIPGPYNTYLANGRIIDLPRDPNLPPVLDNISGDVISEAGYAYTSDGQTFLILSMCYEGEPPSGHKFSNTHPYWDDANAWQSPGPNYAPNRCSNQDWGRQIFVSSPRG